MKGLREKREDRTLEKVGKRETTEMKAEFLSLPYQHRWFGSNSFPFWFFSLINKRESRHVSALPHVFGFFYILWSAGSVPFGSHGWKKN